MRKLLLIAGIAAIAVPGLASAQPGCREQQHDNRVTGTVLGAVGGALLGSAVAGHGSKTAGAVIGGVAGGAVGNAVGGASTNCDYRTGYYDSGGAWHAANGYYDRYGTWHTTYNDRTSGYYDSNGVSHAAAGYYDSYGNWVAATPPVVADNGYDYYRAPNTYDYSADVAFTGSRYDLTGRENWLERRIRAGQSSGVLTYAEADSDLHILARIRRDQAAYGDRDSISDRLDSLTNRIRSQWSD